MEYQGKSSGFLPLKKGCKDGPDTILEAPGGFEPSNGGFADLSLSHLGTAPDLDC